MAVLSPTTANAFPSHLTSSAGQGQAIAMSSNSPAPAPFMSMSMMDWDESAVQAWLAKVGLGQYEEVIYEQGITGDVLAVMDHASLIDLGMTSVGHRLNLLRAVWELKKEQGVEFGEDDWQPQDMPDVQLQKEIENVRRLWDMIVEQNERLMNLERDHARMLSTLAEHGLEVPVASSADGELDRLQARRNGNAPGAMGAGRSGSEAAIPGMRVGRSGSLRGRDQGTRSDEEQEGGSGRNPTRRVSMLLPPTLSGPINANGPPQYDPALNAFPANASSPRLPLESPTDFRSYPSQAQAQLQIQSLSYADGPKPSSSLQKPPFKRLLSENSIMGAPGPSPPAPVASTPPGLAASLGPSSLPGSAPPPSHSTGSHTPQSQSGQSAPSENDKSRAKDAAHSAAKSFRVTLEDPCWKVLPAALKKYKINDDWKMYALFICFGNTERCLSYDEKPLLLFQKLKESGQRPVFMLRHVRDIKSPITVAQQKQATKLGLPPNSEVNVLPKIKPASESSASPTKSGTLQPTTNGREDGRGFPELPSPRLQDGESMGNRSGGASRTLVDKDGNVTTVTYAVAIYPYIADRQDEFDVAVGATFVILSKAKGWYIVQKDPEGQGKIVPDQSKSGWVPAGCLLELSSPIALATSAAEANVNYPGLSPLPPTAIMSSSYPGLVLMDYQAKGDDELSLKEGEKVKVYKKYCHWSYTIKQDTGERGWVPAWFIGKVGGSTSNPSSASAAGSNSATSGSIGPSTGSIATGGSSAPNTAVTDIAPATAVTPRDQATASTTSSMVASTPSTGGSGAQGEDEDVREGGGREGYL